MKRTVIILAFFAILIFISSLMLYYTHQLPIVKKSVVTLYLYGYSGAFNYTATLKPNTIYDNKTTLKLGEGTIYSKITDHIDVNFTYVFEGDLQANFTIKYSVYGYVETANFEKQISELPEKIIETTGTSPSLSINNIPTIDPSAIQQLVREINDERGIFESEYSLNITIIMNVEAKTSVGTVNEFFTPTLNIEFKSSPSEGEIISISGLEHSETGEITETEGIYQPWVDQQRNVSYGLSIASFFGLIISAWFFIKNRSPKPPEPEKLLEEIISPYAEIIAEAQGPSGKEGHSKFGTAIAVKTLEDLVKIAETIEKPILHIHKAPETHIFRIIDDATQYEFTTTISAIAKRKAVIEEEENE